MAEQDSWPWPWRSPHNFQQMLDAGREIVPLVHDAFLTYAKHFNLPALRLEGENYKIGDKQFAADMATLMSLNGNGFTSIDKVARTYTFQVPFGWCLVGRGNYLMGTLLSGKETFVDYMTPPSITDGLPHWFTYGICQRHTYMECRGCKGKTASVTLTHNILTLREGFMCVRCGESMLMNKKVTTKRPTRGVLRKYRNATPANALEILHGTETAVWIPPNDPLPERNPFEHIWDEGTEDEP